jgi:Holliday junction resolvase-like predicted endonuclease
MELEQIRKYILSGKPIEEIVEKFNWQEFEQLVAKIHEDNNFLVKRNFRFKTSRRFEIDVVAVKSNFILCADCKEWSRGRYKKSGLVGAARKQEERVKQLGKFLKANLLARKSLKLGSNYKIYPSVVTWLQEDLIKENETFVIPVWKLNSFLVDVYSYM